MTGEDLMLTVTMQHSVDCLLPILCLDDLVKPFQLVVNFLSILAYCRYPLAQNFSPFFGCSFLQNFHDFTVCFGFLFLRKEFIEGQSQPEDESILRLGRNSHDTFLEL